MFHLSSRTSQRLFSTQNKTYLMTTNDRGKSFVEMVVAATVILKGSKHILFHNCFVFFKSRFSLLSVTSWRELLIYYWDVMEKQLQPRFKMVYS